MNKLMLTAVTALAAFAIDAHAAGTMVFASKLNKLPLPAQLSPGSAQLEPVQGYEGLGHPGNRFRGKMLRSPGNNVVTLTLTDLPPHRYISLRLLFAAIDSWDGSGTWPADDNFVVTLDGHTVFHESFANATPDEVQSYVPPPRVELARHADLGFSVGTFYLDSAYDLGADPVFRKIPHTASTATFTFSMEGEGVQDLADESWAIDNLHVVVGP